MSNSDLFDDWLSFNKISDVFSWVTGPGWPGTVRRFKDSLNLLGPAWPGQGYPGRSGKSEYLILNDPREEWV